MTTINTPRSVVIIATRPIRQRCHAVLTRAGERPVSSRGPRLAGARRVLRAHRPSVILLDAVASPLRALRVLPTLKRLRPSARVLLIGTRSTSVDVVLEGLRLGSCGHIALRDLARDLPKAVRSVGAGEPWLPRRLGAAIVAALRRAVPLDPEPSRLRLLRDRGARIHDHAGTA